MQLHKFYGCTLRGALGSVRRELGENALILETRALEPGSAAERMHPGARYEACAVLEAPVAKAKSEIRSSKFETNSKDQNSKDRNSVDEKPLPARLAGRAACHAAYGISAATTPADADADADADPPAPARAAQATTQVSAGQDARMAAPSASAQAAIAWRSRSADAFLEDLGLLRAQIRELLEDRPTKDGVAHGSLDLREYQELIALGVSHEILAPHFRSWLQWRTATPAQRRYLAGIGQAPAADRMQGETLREWLWHAWSARQGMDSTLDAEQSVILRQQVVGLIGATGVGKTTTLAKISSILRHHKRQNNVIITLDTQRFGANEQIRRLTKLLGVALHEIVTPEDLSQSMETWGNFDWVGIDTPGGMTPGSQAGRLYGSVLARLGKAGTLMLLPAGLNQEDGQAQLRRGEAFGARRVIFSKLDETTRPGGMINLTMDGKWKIDSVTTGQRVPDDWSSASGRLLWNQVLAPREPGSAGRMLA